jgi:exonuclease VII large subunit
MTTTTKTTNWKQEFEQQRSSEIAGLKRKQDVLQQELSELKLEPIKQDQQDKLKHLNDRVMSTKHELGKYPENVITTIKRIEQLHTKRNELLKKNELVLIVIQVKELDELISNNIPNDLQTAVEGLLQMTQLLELVTDEQVKSRIVEIKNIH